MATVHISISEYSNPPLYNAINLSFFVSDQVCYKPKEEYQINTEEFEADSLIYTIDNSVATVGWYSDGINRGQWDGESLISFIPCAVNWQAAEPYCVQSGEGGEEANLDHNTTASGTGNGFSVENITESTSLLYSLEDTDDVINLVIGDEYRVVVHANAETESETAHCDLNVDVVDTITSVSTHLYYDTQTTTGAGVLSEYFFIAEENKTYYVVGHSFVTDEI
jgi:hypothetical protein